MPSWCISLGGRHAQVVVGWLHAKSLFCFYLQVRGWCIWCLVATMEPTDPHEEPPVRPCCLPCWRRRPTRANAALAQPLRDDSQTDDEALERLRECVLREVLVTERSYVADLHALCSGFLRPLSSQGPVEVLPAVESLLCVHEELLRQLEDVRPPLGSAASVDAIARAFGTMTPYLRMYSSFCASYPRALQWLSSLPASTLTQAEESAGQPLGALLIKPVQARASRSPPPPPPPRSREPPTHDCPLARARVQRLCKYPLFLDQLLGSLPPASSRDDNYASRREDISRVADATRALNEEVNSKVLSATAVRPRSSRRVIALCDRRVAGRFARRTKRRV